MPFEIVIESRDQFVHNAVAWCIGQKASLNSAVAAVVNARDQSPTVFSLARGHGFLNDFDVWYMCEESAEAYCTDTKPEPWRRIILRGNDEAGVHAFIKHALCGYREFLSTVRANEGVTLYTWDDRDGWIAAGDAPHRTIDSLLLPDDAGHTLLSDLRTFVSPETRDQYTALSIPMIKIIMLHGTPGSGKTSLVRCLASELGMHIANYAGEDVSSFSEALVHAPQKCIVSVEDIDCMLGSGNQRERKGFAQLLGALDGVSRKDPLIVCFTTNFPGGLDIALRRRVDHCLQFKHATKQQCLALIRRFFPTLEDPEALWKDVTNDGMRSVTMAVLQKFLVRSMTYGSPSKLLSTDPEAFTSLFNVTAENSYAMYN